MIAFIMTNAICVCQNEMYDNVSTLFTNVCQYVINCN